jgi:RsiW-degrading membrane proteinase PrsW (M82 family)
MTDLSTPPTPPTFGSYPAPPPHDVISPEIVNPKPPRRWLGPKGGWFIFLGLTFFWLWNVLFDQLVLHHVALSTNSLVFGGFGMTAALTYTIAYRLREQDGISVVRLGLAFLLGGLLATEFAIMIESALGLALESNAHGTMIMHALAGVIEEACKLLGVVIMARGLAVRNARNGLFLGGAVGLGFAAFEDMRYAWASIAGNLNGHDPLAALLGVTFGRDVIGPFEHPVMTALLAAALFAATRDGRWRITGRVVLVYLGVAAVHGLIDTSPDLLALVLPPPSAAALGLLAGVLVALGSSTIWLVYSRRLKRRMFAQGSAVAPPSAEPASLPS